MPSDNVQLDGDPSGLIRALNRATFAWNEYNKNLAQNIILSKEIANVTVNLTTALNAYKTTAKGTADQQQRISRNLSNTNRSLNAAARNTERLSTATNAYRAQAASMNDQLGKTARGASGANSNVMKLSLSLQGMARLVSVQLLKSGQSHRTISRRLSNGDRALRRLVTPMVWIYGIKLRVPTKLCQTK